MLSYIAGSSYEWMPFHCVYMSACSSLTGESAGVIASQTPLRFTNEPVLCVTMAKQNLSLLRNSWCVGYSSLSPFRSILPSTFLDFSENSISHCFSTPHLVCLPCFSDLIWSWNTSEMRPVCWWCLVHLLLSFLPELVGSHQEESTHWLPSSCGNFAQEQCPCPGNGSEKELVIGTWTVLIFLMVAQWLWWALR